MTWPLTWRHPDWRHPKQLARNHGLKTVLGRWPVLRRVAVQDFSSEMRLDFQAADFLTEVYFPHGTLEARVPLRLLNPRIFYSRSNSVLCPRWGLEDKEAQEKARQLLTLRTWKDLEFLGRKGDTSSNRPKWVYPSKRIEPIRTGCWTQQEERGFRWWLRRGLSGEFVTETKAWSVAERCPSSKLQPWKWSDFLITNLAPGSLRDDQNTTATQCYTRTHRWLTTPFSLCCLQC